MWSCRIQRSWPWMIKKKWPWMIFQMSVRLYAWAMESTLMGSASVTRAGRARSATFRRTSVRCQTVTAMASVSAAAVCAHRDMLAFTVMKVIKLPPTDYIWLTLLILWRSTMVTHRLYMTDPTDNVKVHNGHPQTIYDWPYWYCEGPQWPPTDYIWLTLQKWSLYFECSPHWMA